jgi:PAS domain S-box-containing protein
LQLHSCSTTKRDLLIITCVIQWLYMTMKRTSLHLDDLDLKALERLAKIETQRTGSRVSASQMVRRLIREFLHNLPSFGHGQDHVFNNRPGDGTLEAVIVRDEDGTIRYWSREAELIYGWTPQEVLGARTHTLFKTQFPTSLTRIEKQAREQLSWNGQLIHRRRDGSLVTVNSRWNIQRSPQNKSLTVVEVNTDSRGLGFGVTHWDDWKTA